MKWLNPHILNLKGTSTASSLSVAFIDLGLNCFRQAVFVANPFPENAVFGLGYVNIGHYIGWQYKTHMANRSELIIMNTIWQCIACDWCPVGVLIILNTVTNLGRRVD